MKLETVNPAQVVTAAAVAVVAWFVVPFLRDLAASGRRFDMVELWDRNAPGFEGATDEQRRAVQDDLQRLRALAEDVASAPGFLSDDETKAVRAVMSVRSRYALLWLNRMLAGAPSVRRLGIFGERGPASMGLYLDAFLSNADWAALLRWYNSLPKY